MGLHVQLLFWSFYVFTRRFRSHCCRLAFLSQVNRSNLSFAMVTLVAETDASPLLGDEI